MTDYGLLPEGFSAKTSDVIFDELATDQTAAIGPLWNARVLSLIGVVNSIVATQLGAVWEGLAAVAKQFDPRDAEGEALDSVGALRGTLRRPRRRTVVQVTSGMLPGTSFTAGQLIAHVVGAPNARFQNSFGFTVPGSGFVLVPIVAQFESIDFGPIPCPANYLTLPDVIVAGWTSPINLADGVLGDGPEQDEPYRARQQDELAAGGSATLPALIAALGAVADVTSVAVIVNDTDAVVDTVPTHSFEAVVEGGSDADVAQAIFNEKAPGDGTSGNTNAVVTAPDGLAWVINWTRPIIVPIYVDVTIQVTSEYPGDAALKTFLADWANSVVTPGSDVVPSRIGAKCFEVAGVWNVTLARAGLGSGTTGTFITAIGTRSKASFNTVRIAVTRV